MTFILACLIWFLWNLQNLKKKKKKYIYIYIYVTHAKLTGNISNHINHIPSQAHPNSTIEPGIPLVFNFTVVTNATGSYTIRARTDRSFSLSFPSSLDTGTEGSAQGIVTLTAPSNTESGTDVTLTIEAEDPESSDSNYVAVRFTVMNKVTLMKAGEKQK